MHRRSYGGDYGRSRGELIGRGPEIAQLTQALAAARQGAGGVVLLWGGAGVGKTRLLGEFASAARAADAQTASAACFEYVRPAFGVFDELFRRLGLTETGGKPGAPAKNASDAAAVKHARFSAAAARLAQAGPGALAVTIDDLQWADLGSLELLSFAAAQLRGSRALLIAAVRTDDIERDAVRFEMIEKLKREATASLEVRPLAADEMRRLIEQLCGDAALPETQISRICTLAEGRPYFAEELVVNALRAGEAADALTPPSIRASVLARFVQLAPADRNAILHAAAIGRRFEAAFLAELLALPIDRVWGALSAARGLQLIVEAGDGTGEIAFRHAITREVIYRELLTGQARAIHTRIAQLLDERPAADPTELAYHWRAGGDPARAAESSEAAGDAAFARAAYEDAAVSYRHALGAGTLPDDQRPALCEKFSRALSICGDVTEALEWSRRAVDGYVGMGEPARAAACALWLSRRQYDAAQSERAIATARWALEMLQSSRDTAARFDAYMTLASFETLQGRTDAAARHLAIAETLERGQPADLRSSFYTIRAMVEGARHRLRAAFDDFSRALEFARQSGIDSYVAWTLNNYASRATDTGHPDVALPLYDEAVAIAEQNHLGKIAALASQGYAIARLLAGGLTEALELRRRGLRAASAGVLPDSIAAAVALRVAFLSGEDAPALRYLEDETLERGFAAGETQIVGLLAGCACALLEAHGRGADAGRLRSRALACVNGVNSSYWLLDRCAACDDPAERARARDIVADAATDPDNRAAAAYLSLFDARVAAREGGTRAAKLTARAAAERFAAIGWPWEEGQAHELAGEPARALALYERHGFQREIERLTQARRRARHRPHSGELTPRELDVARLAAAGLSNRRIAETLAISRRTVETHIAAMFDRFDLTSRVQLVRLVSGEKNGPGAT